jgi:hypothetical protein
VSPRNNAALLVLSVSLGASSCTTVPEKADWKISLAGNYQSIADCAFMDIRKLDSAWSKTDYPSLSKSQIVLALPGGGTIGEITVEASGPTTTSIESHMPRAAMGKEWWGNKLRPYFQRCAG